MPTPISWLVTAVIIIVLFAATRAIFSFVQAYMAEKTSQGIAFDFRNEIFAKVQRLSFSYHDRNQTGQLMVRATDDVERVRMFIAQGLIMLVQSLVLLVCHADHPVCDQLAAHAGHPSHPADCASWCSSIFARLTQPLFAEIQRRLSTSEYGAAGKPRRDQGRARLRPRKLRAGALLRDQRLATTSSRSRSRAPFRSCSR